MVARRGERKLREDERKRRMRRMKKMKGKEKRTNQQGDERNEKKRGIGRKEPFMKKIINDSKKTQGHKHPSNTKRRKKEKNEEVKEEIEDEKE